LFALGTHHRRPGKELLLARRTIERGVNCLLRNPCIHLTRLQDVGGMDKNPLRTQTVKRKLHSDEIILLQKIDRHTKERQMGMQAKPYAQHYVNLTLMVSDVEFLLKLIEEGWEISISHAK